MQRNRPGPEPERLKPQEDDWEEAVNKALKKPKPEGGWPKPTPDRGRVVPGKPTDTDDDEEERADS